VKNVAIFGAGKMAREVVLAAGESSDFQVSAIISRTRPDWLFDCPYFSSLTDVAPLPDLLVDFTLSGGTYDAAHWCRASLVPLVSGTTGLNNRDRKALTEAAELVPVMWAPNLSKGLNLLMRSVVEAALALPPDTPVEIVDVHHIHKIDAPSGTALLLAQAIASARKQNLDDCLVIEPAGKVGKERPGKIICISRREGEVTGEHHVIFLTQGEKLHYSHLAKDRTIYAIGSLEAGSWLIRQPAGLYTSSDWLTT
jgi:4-hydroxy-tetrahydrodipicolinate reductase